jgi:hypothetical protein
MAEFILILVTSAVATALGLWAFHITEGPGGDSCDRELEREERDLFDRLSVGPDEWLP